MKFCYLDESGTGSEPFAVMAGIIVDSQRMRLTKSHWAELLNELSRVTGKNIKEFHTREFYRGNGPWHGLDGKTRANILNAILDWLIARKHKITFGGIDKEKYTKNCESEEKLKNMNSLWCVMAFHQILIIQKTHKNQKNNKGNTLLVFDKEVTEEKKLGFIVNNPPDWSDKYYGKKKKEKKLDQIVDVPYFGDSEQVHLIQVADVIAYILRLYLEIKAEKTEQKYDGELENLENLVEKIKSIALSTSSRYLSKGRDEASEVFFQYAPKFLSEL